MSDYVWLTEASQLFLERDYLLPGQSVDDRVTIMADKAEQILRTNGYARKFRDYFRRGWYSFSTPVWTNFGTRRGLPISCFGSYVPDRIDGIMYTMAELGMMSKFGGGTSAYFGDVRGRGAEIFQNGQSSGSVHFMQLPETIVNVISQGKCYIEGTEVLTDSGFKDFREVNLTDKLAQVDAKGRTSFTRQYQLVVEDFEGELVCLSGKKKDDSVSIKVTPNHRMVINRRKMKKGQKYWSDSSEIVYARGLSLHRDNRVPLAGFAGVGQGLTVKDRLRIAYQADGIKDGPNRKIRFHLDKDRKINDLQLLLDSAGYIYEYAVQADGTVDINIDYDPSIKKNTFREWVQIDSVNGTWAQEFIEELSQWDGHIAHGGAIIFSSTVRDNVEIVQAVAALANMKSRLSQREAEGNRQTLYIITLSEGAYRSGEAINITREYYNGKVYCAVVPHGRLIVRYQGRVMVCGNTRRGNCAVYQRLDHPDIHEYLTIRSEGSPIQDLNFGVCVTDAWMRGMIAGDADKRSVWAKVLQCRQNTGYPYIFFTDNANRDKPEWYRDLPITHSNLCTEIMLPDNEFESFVCDLGSMNDVYWEEWRATDAVQVYVWFLDAVMTDFIDKARDIPFLDRAVKFAERHRAIGLGQFGWHSYLQSKMIPLESRTAQTTGIQIAKFIQHEATIATQALAAKFGEPEVLQGYGRRNSTLTAIAPTKSSSFIIGQASESCEPIRSNYYVKDLAKGKFTVRNSHLEDLLRRKGENTEGVWQSILQTGGSVSHLDFLKPVEKQVFRTFQEISQKELVVQASQRQRYIDQGQSLNLMIGPGVPTKDVNKLLIEGWELGIKSFYYQISVNAAQEFARNILSCVACE